MRWKRKGMVYMKINFNNYFRYYAKSNKRFIILICLILFLVLPFLMLRTLMGIYIVPDEAYQTSIFSISAASAIAGCGLSFIMPIFNYRYLYKKSSNELYFSLPIKKEKLFIYTFLSGLIMVLIPLAIYYFLCYGYCVLIFPGVRLYHKFIPLLFFLALCILLTVQYTIFSFLSVKCNNLLDSILINGSYVVMPFIIFIAGGIFFQKQIDLILGNISGGISEFIPIEPLCKIVSLPYVIMMVCGDLFSHIQGYMTENAFLMNDIVYILYWIIIGIVCFWFGRKAFIDRKPEEAQERTKTIFGYPVVITVVTFCLLLVMMNGADDFVIPSVMIIMLYFCMIFFSNRKIKVKGIHILIFVILYAGTFGFGQVYARTNGFGMVKEFINPSTIQRVNIEVSFAIFDDSIDYSSYSFTLKDHKNVSSFNLDTGKTNEINYLMESQKEISKRKENEYLSDCYNINYYFTTKDGEQRYRSYTLKITEENREFLNKLLQEVSGYSNFTYSITQEEEYSESY